MMFTKIENSEVLIKINGGYKVLPLYKRNSNNQIFAKNGQTYVSLMANGVTSNAKYNWIEIDMSMPHSYVFEKSLMVLLTFVLD